MKTLLSFVLLITIFISCKKESETIQPALSTDYAPLKAGKYITYSLDSLVYINFGKVEAHRFYEVKYVFVDSLTDNLGRKGFRTIRYIRSLPAGTFLPDNTSFSLQANNGFEFTENNLKYLKLANPVSEGKMWKGNSAIDVSSQTIDLQYLLDWDYTYTDVGVAKKVGTFNLDNTVTINQRNDSLNLPIIPNVPIGNPNATQIASKDFSKEIYAKDIGLVYKEFLHYDYQTAFNNGGYIGYGVKLTMIDHN